MTALPQTTPVEKVRKHWTEQRQTRVLKLSATQIEDFDNCKRLWWIKNVRKLPDPPKGSQVLGTVTHGVIERYLDTDELGRSLKTGMPADLYPPGWEIAKNRFDPSKIEGSATPAEQDIVRRLIGQAIEGGILERMPGRKIEHQFNRTVIKYACRDCGGYGKFGNGAKCTTCGGDGLGMHVMITGFIDVFFHYGEVHDHKTVKRMKYALSEKGLKKSWQMLSYARECIEKAREQGLQIPPYVTLRHNAYCKDPNDLRVRKTQTTVSVAEIEHAWSQIQAMAAEMVVLRDTVNAWHEIREPPNMREACNRFGPCTYLYICAGQESEQAFENRLAPNSHSAYPPLTSLTVNGQSPTSSTKGNEMPTQTPVQFTTGFAAQIPQAPHQGFAPQINPPMPIQPVPQNILPGGYLPTAATLPPPMVPLPMGAAVSPMQSGQLMRPPWASCGPGIACEGSGFNSQGIECRICDLNAEKCGKPSSTMFIIQPTGRGTVVWSPRNPSLGLPSGESPLPNSAAHQPVKTEVRTDMSQMPPQQQYQQPPQGAPPMQFGAPSNQPQNPYQQPMPQGQPGQPQYQQPPQPLQPQYQPPPQQPQGQPQYQQPPQQPQSPQPPQQQQQQPQPPQQPQPQGQVPQGQQPPAPEGDGKKNKGGRPAKGFLLLVNASVTKGDDRQNSGRYVHRLEEVLREVGADMAKQFNVPSFYDIDPFQRRDQLRKFGEQIASTFGADIVQAQVMGTGESDLKALFDAVQPYAGCVVMGH